MTKPHDTNPNQGEGDKISARRYNVHVKRFVDDRKVEPAAHDARRYVEGAPEDARRAEEAARGGPKPTIIPVDHLIAKGRGLFERIEPPIRRAIAKLRARLGRSG